MSIITIQDYPILSVGCNVYDKTQSSPIAVCLNPQMANEVARLMNAALQPKVLSHHYDASDDKILIIKEGPS